MNPQALNRYSYVLNNPVRLVDPTGHDCQGGQAMRDEYYEDGGKPPCDGMDCDKPSKNPVQIYFGCEADLAGCWANKDFTAFIPIPPDKVSLSMFLSIMQQIRLDTQIPKVHSESGNVAVVSVSWEVGSGPLFFIQGIDTVFFDGYIVQYSWQGQIPEGLFVPQAGVSVKIGFASGVFSPKDYTGTFKIGGSVDAFPRFGFGIDYFSGSFPTRGVDVGLSISLSPGWEIHGYGAEYTIEGIFPYGGMNYNSNSPSNSTNPFFDAWWSGGGA